MSLEAYRAAVRSVICPLCNAQADEPCREPGEVRMTADDGPVEYVHDDRSYAYHVHLRDRIIRYTSVNYVGGFPRAGSDVLSEVLRTMEL